MNLLIALIQGSAGSPPIHIDPQYGFWLTIYSLSISVLVIWIGGHYWFILSRNKRLTWDLHTEYIDISEFSNRNIPLKITYKSTEPNWLWATYLTLKNTGRVDITSDDCPEKQHLIIGNDESRYIGFNRLISDKAKVTLNPLFKEDCVWCKLEFDKLGPGDEISCSLLFVADEKQPIAVEGNLYGRNSKIISGQHQRMLSWRSLWWLIITTVVVGILGGIIFWQQTVIHQQIVFYQLQILLMIYFLAILTAAVLLRPIRFWQQIPERFHQSTTRKASLTKTIRFIMGLDNEF